MNVETHWRGINWDGVIASLRENARLRGGPRERLLLSHALGLGAHFTNDAQTAAQWLDAAAALDPVDPLHTYRRALLALRFGRSAGAAERLKVIETLLPIPQAAYARVLANRAELVARAKAAVGELKVRFPKFVPGYFLEAEIVALSGSFKGVPKLLASLPRDPRFALLWADLLAKCAVEHPAAAASLVRKEATTGALRDRPEREPVLRILDWNDALGRSATEGETIAAAALVDVITRELSALTGRRQEELFLTLVVDVLRSRAPLDAAVIVRDAVRRVPGSAALRRIYACAMADHAVALAAEHQLTEALRVTDAALRLEPEETTHWLNRAALFTLMRDEESSHDAWEDLDRHHYRLFLLGKADPAAARRIAKTHRMFAEQARMTPESADLDVPRLNLGIFSEQRQSAEEGETIVTVDVNQSRIDRDPEQLRQWIHHRRAELLFHHVALGENPDRLYLFPADALIARDRRDALARAGGSLAILVPEEGAMVAAALAKRWDAALPYVTTRVASAEEDRDAAEVKLVHLQTLADLALLAYRWTPPADSDLLDEMVDFVATEAPFFDDALLTQLMGEQQRSRALLALSHIAADALQIEIELPPLTRAQRKSVTDAIASRLLVRGAYTICRQAGLEKLHIDRALRFLERAGTLTPNSAEVEYLRARLLVAGEHFDQAEESIARVQKLIRTAEEAEAFDISSLRQTLAQAKRTRSGRGAPAVQGETRIGTGTQRRVEDLEAEIESHPASVQAYEELARALALERDFKSALLWSERAIVRCLARRSQIRARALNLEMTALDVLQANHVEVALYLRGTRLPLLEKLDTADPELLDHSVLYVLGQCRVSAHRVADAESAFRAALAKCTRQLHVAVIRPLAANAEQLVVEELRRSIDDALGESRCEEALLALNHIAQTLRAPESVLIDFARIELAAATASAATSLPPLAQLGGSIAWRDRWTFAIALPAGPERAIALAKMAAELDEASAQQAESICRRAEAIRARLSVVSAVNESAALMRAEDWSGALAALDRLGERGSDDADVLNQRAVLLLRLRRFAEADAVHEKLVALGSTAARAFADAYPRHAFTYRIQTANALVRDGDVAAARHVLDPARPVDEAQELELAYVRSFCCAREAYAAHDRGDREATLAAFTEALDFLDAKLPAARERGMTRFVQLHEKLDRDLSELCHEVMR